MLEVKKTTTISGYSRVEESEKPYVYFSSTIQEDGTSNVNYNIQDEEVFRKNEDIFEADRKEFETNVKQLKE